MYSINKDERVKELVKKLQGIYLKKSDDPEVFSVRSIEGRLRILFSNKIETERNALASILSLLREDKSRFAKLGSGLISSQLISTEMIVLAAFCKCDSDEIIENILKNNNLTVKSLMLLNSKYDKIISDKANKKLRNILNEVKNFIVEKNMTSADWGTRSLDGFSILSVKERVYKIKKSVVGENWIKDLTDRKTIQCEKSTSKEKENLIKIPKKNLLTERFLEIACV